MIWFPLSGGGWMQGLSKIKADTLLAMAASALVWLLGFPTVAIDKTADKTDFAIFSICRAEQHVDIAGGAPRITIESGMGDGGFPIATRPSPPARYHNEMK